MAKVKVKINSKAILKSIKPDIVKRAHKVMPKAIEEIIIKKQILRGVSPVAGQGRFVKYSDSYRSQIKGQTAFFKGKGGSLNVVSALSSRDLREGRASKSARKQNAKNKKFVKEFNAKFKRLGKKTTPVNMKLTGDMIDTFYINRFPNGFKVGFNSKKAPWHNDGAGDLPTRRLLPNNRAEKFNKTISRVITKELKQVVTYVLKRKGLLKK